MEKYQNFYLLIFIFLVLKFSVYLNRHVFVMCFCIHLLSGLEPVNPKCTSEPSCSKRR